MEIIFVSSKLCKECNEHARAVRRYGPVTAKLLRRRLDEIFAAETLADLGTLPQTRCHELVGDKKGQLSVDLKHPLRLLLEPANEPIPRKPDGGLLWEGVTAVRMLGEEDTHG
ncbi:MAG: killer suppression protein [Planctomycetes bacterium]|nr:killer suppression protein [Planctomycetota bacterium]